MKLRDFLPPVVTQGFDSLVRRSFAAAALAWRRGDDITDAPVSRLTQPYAQSAWIHAAVNHVAGEISGRPLKFYRSDEEYTDPAFEAWWSAPALGPRTAAGTQPRLTQAQVKRDLALWAKLEGEFFLLFDDTWALASLRRNPAALSPFIIARPDRVRLIISAAEIQGYEYIDAGGRRTVYLPEQVTHWKAANPYDDWRGLGDLSAATVAAAAAFHTGVYIRDLMRNNGDQGFIVVGKSGVADDLQREQIVADLRAKRAALRAGLAKDLFLTGDIAIERPKEQAAGAELLQGMALTHQEVFVAFGVPPSMAEVKASYSVGKDSDYYQLIIRTCLPLGNEIAAELARAGARMTGQALTAELEWDDHPVMVEVRNARLDQALKLWNAGMAWADINDYLDLGMEEFPGWDIPYLPFSVVPVDVSGSRVSREPTVDPNLAESPEQRRRAELPDDPAIAQLKLLLAVRQRSAAPRIENPKSKIENPAEHDALAAFACGHNHPEQAKHAEGYTTQKADRPAAEIARWRTHMQQRRETVASYKSAFTRVLMSARIETLRKLEGRKSLSPDLRPLTSVNKSAADDLLFNLSQFSEAFTAAMRNQGKAALDRAGRQLMGELGKDDPFTFAPHEVLQFLTARENKLAGVPQDVFDKIRASLQAGLDAGESTADLAKRVKAEFNSIADRDALRIAQTETSAAYGTGRQEAMVKAGVQFKAWLTSGNANVREAHQLAGLTYPADGGIPVDQPFIVDGEELMHPGDSTGSAGNVINCHCVSIPVVEPEELKARDRAAQERAVQPIHIHLPAPTLQMAPAAPPAEVKFDITLHQTAQPDKKLVSVKNPDGSHSHYRTETIAADKT